MTVWLVRAGKHGEFEQKFLQENKVYVTWDGLSADLGKMKEKTGTLRGNDPSLPRL